MQHVDEFSGWAETVLGAGYQPRHEYRRVGSLPSFVLEDQAVVALKPEGVDVYISDMQVLHACRDTKARRGAALPISVVLDLPGRLAGARWVFDASHDGVIAFFDAGVDGHLGKAVVHFNHIRKKVRYSAILTMGLVQPENENARVYRALKPKA